MFLKNASPNVISEVCDKTMKTINLSLTGEYLISRHLGFAILVKTSAKLHGEGLCSWPPKGGKALFEKFWPRSSALCFFCLIKLSMA